MMNNKCKTANNTKKKTESSLPKIKVAKEAMKSC